MRLLFSFISLISSPSSTARAMAAYGLYAIDLNYCLAAALSEPDNGNLNTSYIFLAIFFFALILFLILRWLWKRTVKTAVEKKLAGTVQKIGEAENNFYTITDNVTDGILINQGGIHVYANKGLARMLGYKQNELLGTTIQDVVHAEVYEEIQQRANNRIQGNVEPEMYETNFINKSGDIVPVEITAGITQWQGKPAGIAIIRDITERQLIENTLRDSEKRYRSIVENSPDAIVILDAVSGQFMEANEQAAELFKLDKPALFASSILRYMPRFQTDGSLSESAWEKIINKVLSGERQNFEWQIYDSNKQTIPCEIRLSRMPFPKSKLIRGNITDISQRKKIETALTQSELRLSRFFQASFEVLLFHDNGIIQDINDNAYTICGYEREDVIGHSVFDFIAPQSHALVKQNMASGNDGPYELFALRKDHTEFPAIIMAKTIELDGKPLRAVSLIDNTPIKNIENELIAAGKELHTILDNMIDTFYRTDAKGILTKVSPSVKDLLGYTVDEVIGQPMHEFYVDPDGRDKFLKAINEARGNIKAYEAALKHKDGHEVWVSTNAHIIRSDTGEVLGIEGTTRDITQQRNMNQVLQETKDALELRFSQRNEQLTRQVADLEQLQFELKSSEQRFRTLFDNAADILLLHDTKGNIIDVNQQACKSLSYSKKELQHLTIDDIDIGPNPVSIEKLANLLNSGKSFRTDSILKRKDGTNFPVEVNLGLLQKDGQRMILASLRDITDRKQFELELLVAKEEAEKANQAKSDFLSRMSHELRTPMNAIIGFSELLETDKDDPLTPSQHDSMTEILNAARHLLDLINDILDLARVESGRLSINMEPVLINDLITESIALIQPLVKEKEIQIINHAKNCNNEVVEVDNTRMKQIILNLLSNAVKYNRDKGSITIECEKVDTNKIKLSIHDSGDGLTPEQIGRLFNPFDRLDADQLSIEGTGIGLVISKLLIELMGGRIGVVSKPGTGSQFWIEMNRLEH